MDQNQEAIRATSTRSRLEQLPLEAKQSILSSLTNIASLKATALTCSSLYQAFKSAEELIITEVFLNEIDIDVLPEAIIAHKSETWTRPPVFAAEHLQSRQPISSKKRLNIPELLPLSKTAKHIDYFAHDFASQALAARPPISAPPSREELNRIKRAFYRFEIYGNMFTSLSPPTQMFEVQVHVAPAAIFFACFSPWENEQLACVHDYLFSIVAPSMFCLLLPTLIFILALS